MEETIIICSFLLLTCISNNVIDQIFNKKETIDRKLIIILSFINLILSVLLLIDLYI